MEFNRIKEQEQQYVMQTYGRVNVALVKGKNATATDADGKQYIDFTSGIGVNSLGFSDPQWVSAVAEQAGEIQHISNYYYHPKCTELAQRLSELSGMSRSFFCNSGAEANECAIKVAREYGDSHSANRIITLKDSFHGRTLTTLAATGQEAFHQQFLPLTQGFVTPKENSLKEIKNLLDETICAVMIEMIQGEGGVNTFDSEFIHSLRRLCDENAVLLIIDEVQTGIGRTGNFFAYQGHGVNPDIVTCAKGIAGGLPMGVCMVSEKLREIMKPGMNGSTFGANPVACAGALEVLRRISAPGFLGAVKEKSKRLRSGLQKLSRVMDIHGEGLILGMDIDNIAPSEVLKRCAENGLLVLTAKNRVRFLPPLTITEAEIDRGLKIFSDVLDSFD